MNLSDEKIKELAERVGFWGADIWWRHKIPKLRRFIEETIKEAKSNELDTRKKI